MLDAFPLTGRNSVSVPLCSRLEHHSQRTGGICALAGEICLRRAAQQRLFLVQTGVMGKAKQRSRAVVGRIPAGVGSVPKPAARERQECSGT
ncbi:Histone-Lysine N-Methyltransferase 2C [Manis pentadactyla]|nr:Histone-Lysine N-Methyltransferase 2C [Manis pentadactyla]